MRWEEDAISLLDEVPQFIREKVKNYVEEFARKKGMNVVTKDVFEDAKKAFFGEKKEKDEIRIAIVRCDIISEVCPGIGCLQAYEKKNELFKRYKGKNVRLIGFFTCGGCSGRRVFRLVNTLKKYGLDIVHMSSCMLMEEPFVRCPNKEEIKKSIERLGVEVVEGTHHEVGQYASGRRYHDKG